MISEMYLAELERELATTRRVLERIPDDALEWTPHEKSFTLQALATHLVNILTWVEATLDMDELDMAGGFEPPPSGDRAALLEIFDANVAAARARIERATDEEWQGMWTLRTGDEVHFAMPKVAVMRGFVISHLIHHRAQLALYLRLRDVPVPAIYGPSADEMAF